jgi:capsular polysaccharide transport system ATP-binding protein
MINKIKTTIKNKIIKKKKETYNGIYIKNLTKKFSTKLGPKLVLDNINIKIPYGKNIGILGKNGAGKSTLLRLMGKIEFPEKGEIISNKTFSWPLALSNGFQGSLTGKDNAKFICRIYGKKEEELERIVENIKEFSELGNDFYLPVKTYSTGMKGKLSFAVSVSFDFDYFLLDETLSVGDKSFKDKCSKAIKDIGEKSNFIIVSHDMNVIRNMCDICLIIKNKKILIYEDMEKAISEYNLM